MASQKEKNLRIFDYVLIKSTKTCVDEKKSTVSHQLTFVLVLISVN